MTEPGRKKNKHGYASPTSQNVLPEIYTTYSRFMCVEEI